MSGPMGNQNLLSWNPHWAGQIEVGVARRTKKYVAKPLGHAIRRVYNQTVVNPLNKAKAGIKSRYNKVRAKVTFQKARDRRIARKKGYIQAQQRIVKFAENKEEKRLLIPRATYTDREAAIAEKNRIQELGYRTELTKKTVISKVDGTEKEQWELSTLRIPYKKTKEEKQVIAENKRAVAENERAIAETKRAEAKEIKARAHAEAKLKRDVQIASTKVEWAMKRQQSRIGKILKPWTAKAGEFEVEQRPPQATTVAGEKKAKVGGLGDQSGNAIPPDKTEEYYWSNPKAKYEGPQTEKPLSARKQAQREKRALRLQNQRAKKEQKMAELRSRMGFGKNEAEFNPELERKVQKPKATPIKLVAPQVKKELSAKQKAYAERAKQSREAPQRIATLQKHMAQKGTGELQEMTEQESKEKKIGKGKQRKIAKVEAIKASTEAQMVIDSAPPKNTNKLTNKAQKKPRKTEVAPKGTPAPTTAQVLQVLGKAKEKVENATKELAKGNKAPAIQLLGNKTLSKKQKEQAENVRKFEEQTRKEEAEIIRRNKKLAKGGTVVDNVAIKKLLEAQHPQTPNSGVKKTRAEHEARDFVHKHVEGLVTTAKQELDDAKERLAREKEKAEAKKIKAEAKKEAQALADRPTSIDNPYMSYPLERVALDAEKGNLDAQKALKLRKTATIRRV